MHIICSVIFFLKIVPLMRLWKSMVEPDRAQMEVLDAQEI